LVINMLGTSQTAAAQAPSHQQPVSVDCRVDVLDQAIGVLRGTSDGDLLDPRDLALLQTVVNEGLDALTDPGKRHWAGIVQSVVAGTYAKPWMHGVEHLTRDLEGYVFWKGARVEHFSFRGDVEGEREAAIRLGAYCRMLEAQKIQVSGAELHRAWDRTAHAHGLDVPRFGVCWLFEGREVKIWAAPLKEPCRDDLEFEGFVHDTSAKWATTREALRCARVVTLEDYNNAVEAIEGDFDRRSRHSGSESYGGYARKAEILDELRNLVKPARLATEASVLEQILGPYMGSVAAAATAGQPERERG
jgi:hypothetical protein